MGMISLAALALPIAAIAGASYYLFSLANRIDACSLTGSTLDRSVSRSLHDGMRNHENYLVMSAFVPIFVTLLTTHGAIAESLFWVLVAFVVIFVANSLCRGVLRRRLAALDQEAGIDWETIKKADRSDTDLKSALSRALEQIKTRPWQGLDDPILTFAPQINAVSQQSASQDQERLSRLLMRAMQARHQDTDAETEQDLPVLLLFHGADRRIKLSICKAEAIAPSQAKIDDYVLTGGKILTLLSPSDNQFVQRAWAATLDEATVSLLLSVLDWLTVAERDAIYQIAFAGKHFDVSWLDRL